MIFDISKEKYQELRGDVVNLTLGDDKYKNNVNELIDYLSKFKNVKIIESNK